MMSQTRTIALLAILLGGAAVASAAVPAAPDSDHAAWCVLVRGLQAGTTFGQPHYPYRPGETVTYNIYLSNCKDQPVTLVFQEPAAWVPTVYKERGGPVDRDVGGLKDGAAPTERKVTLAPSEKVLVGTVQLKLDATSKDNPGGPHIHLEPGQYHVNWTGRVKESGQADGFEISARSPLLMVAGPEEAAGTALPVASPDATKPSSVGIYLVADPQYVGGAEKVPLADLKLEAKPLLADKDIVAYYWNDHIIQLTPNAFQALQRMREVWMAPGCRAFVVVADGQRCYLGAFESLLASYIPKVPHGYIWTNRQQVLPENAIRIGPSPWWDPKRPQEQDTRNDPRLRQALAALGKFPRTVAAGAPWGEAVDGVQVRLRADNVQWKAGETPTLHVECRNSGKELWYVPKTQPGLGILADGKSYFKPERSEDQYIDRLEPGKTVALANVVLSDWWLTDAKEKPVPLDLQPGKHTVQVVCRPQQIGADASGSGRLDESGGIRGIKISSNPVEIEILNAAAGHGDVAASTGEIKGGVQVGLTGGAEKEYRRGVSLPLMAELKNNGNSTLPPIALMEVQAVVEAKDGSGTALRVRPLADVLPWEAHPTSLSPGGSVQWHLWLDRLAFIDRPAAGSILRLRLHVKSRDFDTVSGWVELTMKDSLPDSLEPECMPNVWMPVMDLVYREVGGADAGGTPLDPSCGIHAFASRAVHVDGSGRVTVAVITGGKDAWLGRHEAVLDRADLDRLAGFLKRQQVWRLAEVAPQPSRPEDQHMQLSVSSAGRLLACEFPLSQAALEPSLLALRREMWALMAKAVAAAHGN